MEEDLSTHVYATLMLCGNCTQEVGCHALVQTRVSQRFLHIYQKFGSNSHSCNIRYVIGAYKLVIFIVIVTAKPDCGCDQAMDWNPPATHHPTTNF